MCPYGVKVTVILAMPLSDFSHGQVFSSNYVYFGIMSYGIRISP